MVQQHLVGQSLIVDASRSNSGHITLSRTPLDESSEQRRDLYSTTHNTHKRRTSMPPAGFEPTIPASERLQTHALDRTATGIDCRSLHSKFKSVFFTYYLSMYQSWDRVDQHAAFGRLNRWSNTVQQTYYRVSHSLPNPAMKILQRNLNRSTFIVWEMKRNVSVVCVCGAHNCRDTEQQYPH